MRTIAGAPTPDELELLERDLILGPTGQRYLERHHLTDLVRYHHILDDDRQPDLHDHPWDFTSMLLTGGYRETTTAGTTEHWAPTVVVRDAEEPHRLELLDGPMWTLVATGPARRRWGFTPATAGSTGRGIPTPAGTTVRSTTTTGRSPVTADARRRRGAGADASRSSWSSPRCAGEN